MSGKKNFLASSRSAAVGAVMISAMVVVGCGGSGQSDTASASAGGVSASSSSSSAVGKTVLDRGVAFTASGVGSDGESYRLNYSVLPLGNVQYQGQTRASALTSVTVFRNGMFVATDRQTTFFDEATGTAVNAAGKSADTVDATATWRSETDGEGNSWACVDSVLPPSQSDPSGLPGSRCFEVGTQGLITGRFKGHLSLPDVGQLSVQFVGSGRYTGSGA